MDIDIISDEEDDKYKFISIDKYIDTPKDEKKLLIKQTLLNSPIITNIIPDFKVKINKPFKGSSSVLFNDEEYQTLIPKEEDSQLDAFIDSDEDEDELFLGLSKTPVPENNDEATTESAHIESIRVIVKNQSILIDGIEFPTKSIIRSSCVIKARTSEDEDHLFISLKSGFLLLIRMYYVPRYYKDDSYSFQSNQNVKNDEGNSIFKPFIIQWWDTSSNLPSPSLDSCGYFLRSSPSGLSTVACSNSNIFRVYTTRQSSTGGTVLKNHFNISIDGFILDACFIEPNAPVPTDVFFVLTFTETRRLTINLFHWPSYTGIEEGLTKSVLPLENTFDIPIFVVPLKNNNSFLFVSPNKLTIITTHNIVSAHYDFKSRDVPWDKLFPTSYYIPTSNLSSLEIDKLDEVVISLENGLLFLVTIIDNSFGNCNPIIRISDSISTFTLEQEASKYRLIYSSFTGASKDFLVDELYSPEYLSDVPNLGKLVHSTGKLIQDFKTWTPLIDVSIIDTSTTKDIPTKQELWGISGIGKKTRLNQFRFGYSGVRKSNTYEKLRKVEGFWKLNYKELTYLVCSLPFETILLEYQEQSKDAFAEIADPKIVTSDSTLFCYCAPNEEFIIQVTESSVIVSNLFYFQITKILDFVIVYCDAFQDCLAMIVEENNQVKLKVFRIVDKPLSEDDNDVSTFFNLMIELVLDYSPTLLKIINHDCVCIGGFDGKLRFYSFKDGFLSHCHEVSLIDYSKYSHDDITDLDVIIPHDVKVANNTIVIGTKEGFYIELSLAETHPTCKKILRIGTTNVKLCPTTDPNLLFIYCNKLWLLNKYESEYPNQVCFDDNYERSTIAALELDSNGAKFKKLALVRDNGLVLSEVSTFVQPSIRQVSKLENGKKLIYVPHISTFVVLCHTPTSKIKCIDRKTVKVVSHKETNIKARITNDEADIFDIDETPQCVTIWEVKKQQQQHPSRITKKVLIGCGKFPENGKKSSGSVKVLDFKKVKNDEFQGILITELTSFDHESPITNILQFNSNIIFTSGSDIYRTSYDEQEKRFTPVKLLQSLPSKITSIYCKNDKLYISTNSDSIYQFQENTVTNSLTYKFSDPLPNSFINQVDYNGVVIAGDKIHSNISIMDMNEASKTSTTGPLLRNNFVLGCIPRVYLMKLNNSWIDKSDDSESVVCVGINGEIISLRLVPESCDELKILTDKLGGTMENGIDRQLQKLNRPFINKISGTGLLSLNKPIFDYLPNRNSDFILDFDLDQLSSIHDFTISL
ncbi:hypothetical protein SBY92_001233 [Candida maltosa Xu316]